MLELYCTMRIKITDAQTTKKLNTVGIWIPIIFIQNFLKFGFKMELVRFFGASQIFWWYKNNNIEAPSIVGRDIINLSSFTSVKTLCVNLLCYTIVIILKRNKLSFIHSFIQIVRYSSGWPMCYVLCTWVTIQTPDQYIRKQDGTHLSGIQMTFKYQTIWHPASFQPLEYH